MKTSVTQVATRAMALVGASSLIRDIANLRSPEPSGPKGAIDTPAGRFSVEPTAPSRTASRVLARGRAPEMAVLGGMGPEATALLTQKIVDVNKELTAPKRDQDFMPFTVFNDTRIADRTGFIVDPQRAPDPRPTMKAVVDRMAALGVTHFAMPCNTAHVFMPDLVAHIKAQGYEMEPVHIVDATLERVKELAPNARTLGLMATDGTVQSGLYQTRAKEVSDGQGAAAYAWVVPKGDRSQAESSQGRVMHAVYGCIKNQEGTAEDRQNRLTEAGTHFRDVAQELADKGADAILLACTEIPIGLREPSIRRMDGTEVPLISTIDALAMSFVRTAQKAGAPVAETPATLDAARQAVAAHVTLEPEGTRRTARADA
jgi:aspartate racemase